MKKIVILSIITLICFTSYGQKKPKIKGNKIVTESGKTIEANFNALEIDDNLEINLRQGNENAYFIKADENLMDVIQFMVTDSILKIFTINKIVSSKKLEISLSVKGLEHIILKNDAKIVGEGEFNSEKLYLSAYSSSKFELNVDATDVTISLHRNAGGKLNIKGENVTILASDRTDLKADVVAENVRVTLTKGAELKMTGDANYAAFNLKGTSKLDARKMKVSSADLYTSNNSDVYIYASKNIELYAQGRSNIYVYGNPKMEVKGLTDKSKIIKK